LKKTKNIDFLKKKQQEIYGRISSVVKQIDKHLIFLAQAQNIIKNFPEIHDVPTVVIAGYPNVGKSSILRCLSSAKPKIAQYPFTTKEIHVGHIERKDKYLTKSFQLIDTPGLLDKPFLKRNVIEKQALSALNNLANIIVFVIDASETCGYLLVDQLHLLSQIKKTFIESDFIIVENKTDLKRTTSKRIKISCKTGEGIDVLIDKIFTLYNYKV
jgi:nucleolar GTP-binding protein